MGTLASQLGHGTLNLTLAIQPSPRGFGLNPNYNKLMILGDVGNFQSDFPESASNNLTTERLKRLLAVSRRSKNLGNVPELRNRQSSSVNL